jgi:hypothetical protein
MVFSLVKLQTRPWLITAALVAAHVGAFSRTPVPATVSAATARPQPGGASSCVTSKFIVTLVPSGARTFAGVIHGDIEGTVVITFDDAFTLRGVTFANGGTAEWELSGGLLLESVAFQTVFENRNQETDRPGSPAWLFENIGRHRAVDGVEKANLSYDGTFDASILQGVHGYHGVICL